jgi:hypothetical protein
MIGIDTTGADAVVARLAGLPDALAARFGVAFAGIGATLYARVQEKLDGEAVRSVTGRLKGAITQEVGEQAASVGLDVAAAPYGAAIEFGASIPAQLIAVKNAKALAFVVAGQQVFAKRVMRPAFVLPAHSFLRSALDEMAPDILAQLGDAVSETVQS